MDDEDDETSDQENYKQLLQPTVGIRQYYTSLIWPNSWPTQEIPEIPSTSTANNRDEQNPVPVESSPSSLSAAAVPTPFDLAGVIHAATSSVVQSDRRENTALIPTTIEDYNAGRASSRSSQDSIAVTSTSRLPRLTRTSSAPQMQDNGNLNDSQWFQRGDSYDGERMLEATQEHNLPYNEPPAASSRTVPKIIIRRQRTPPPPQPQDLTVRPNITENILNAHVSNSNAYQVATFNPQAQLHDSPPNLKTVGVPISRNGGTFYNPRDPRLNRAIQLLQNATTSTTTATEIRGIPFVVKTETISDTSDDDQPLTPHEIETELISDTSSDDDAPSQHAEQQRPHQQGVKRIRTTARMSTGRRVVPNQSNSTRRRPQVRRQRSESPPRKIFTRSQVAAQARAQSSQSPPPSASDAAGHQVPSTSSLISAAIPQTVTSSTVEPNRPNNATLMMTRKREMYMRHMMAQQEYMSQANSRSATVTSSAATSQTAPVQVQNPQILAEMPQPTQTRPTNSQFNAPIQQTPINAVPSTLSASIPQNVTSSAVGSNRPITASQVNEREQLQRFLRVVDPRLATTPIAASSQTAPTQVQDTQPRAAMSQATQIRIFSAPAQQIRINRIGQLSVNASSVVAHGNRIPIPSNGGNSAQTSTQRENEASSRLQEARAALRPLQFPVPAPNLVASTQVHQAPVISPAVQRPPIIPDDDWLLRQYNIFHPRRVITPPRPQTTTINQQVPVPAPARSQAAPTQVHQPPVISPVIQRPRIVPFRPYFPDDDWLQARDPIHQPRRVITPPSPQTNQQVPVPAINPQLNRTATEPIAVEEPARTYDHTCKICETHEIHSILLPCAHFCICQICYDTLQRFECPICRAPITDFKHVFF